MSIIQNTGKGKLGTLLTLCFLVVLLAGCIKEDLSKCGVVIKFKYDINPSGQDRFTTDVQKLDLFVFSQQGDLVEEVKVDGPFGADFGIRLQLPAGVYSFIVGGNLNSKTVLSTSLGSRLVDRRMIYTAPQNIVADPPEPFYYGAKSTVTVKPENNGEVLIPMMKVTKRVQAVFKGVPVTGSNSGQFVCRIEAANGDYTFNNVPPADARMLTYLPERTVNTAAPQITDDFVTLRLFENNACKSRLILEYIPPDGSAAVTILDTPLSDAIKKAYPYGESTDAWQNFFLINDLFILEFEVTHTFGNFGITPKGWKQNDNHGGGGHGIVG